ncbi:acyl-CoA-like ligand-binding transcription factor [Gordonia sp. NPDC003950]
MVAEFAAEHTGCSADDEYPVAAGFASAAAAIAAHEYWLSRRTRTIGEVTRKMFALMEQRLPEGPSLTVRPP